MLSDELMQAGTLLQHCGGLRLPAGAPAPCVAGAGGATLCLKTGHLPTAAS